MAEPEPRPGQIVLSRRQLLGAIAVVGTGVSVAEVLTRSQNTSAQTPSLSPEPIICESPQPSPSASPIESASPFPVETLEERLARLNITPEMQEVASREFDDLYKMIKSRRFMDGRNGSLIVQHGQNPNAKNALIEYQAFGEILAVYAGDMMTAQRLMRFDDIYKYQNTEDRDLPDGLTPWDVFLSDVGNEKDVANIWEGKPRKKDGQVNWADMEDPTVVANVMMYMALARLTHTDLDRQTEGREILEAMARRGMIDSGVPQAFHWDDSNNLTNPAFMNMVLIEMAARLSPDWAEVPQGTMDFFGKVDERIINGEYAAPPNWVTMDAKPRNNEDNKPEINYDIAYYVMNQLHAAIYAQDPAIRDDAIEHIKVVNKFFQKRIAFKDSDGNVKYDSHRLLDGYKLNGKVDYGTKEEPEERYPDTGFTTAATMASLVSEDEEYRNHMFSALKDLRRPAWEPINDLFNAAAFLAISGRMETASPK